MQNFQGFLCSEAVVHVLFNKVSSLKTCNFKKIFQRRCFTVYFATFLRTHFLQNTSGGCLCILKWSFICYFLICMAVPLTLSRMGLFQGCWWIGGAKRFHLTLKSVIFFPTIIKLGTITPYLKNFKKCINHATDSLSFADISIFSPKISNFFHIKKYRYRLHFNT